MSVQTIYNLTDTFWVAGLGADALAAVGFDWGLLGVWWGLVAGTVIGSIITFIWAQLYLKCLMGTNKSIKKC